MFISKESARFEIDWPVKASCDIGVISSQDILSRSNGEVIQPETIDYDNNGDPIPRGFFCENIFGKKETYRCSCSWFGIPLTQATPINNKDIHKFEKHSGSTCQVCGSIITPLKDRLALFGHIKLAAPVTHIWFLKSHPSKIGAILDLTLKQLEAIIYFEQYAVIESCVDSIPICSLLSEEEYKQNLDKFPGQFQVAIGAEAIKKLLTNQDMAALSLKLQEEMATTRSKTKKQKLQERLFVIETFRDSGNNPECIVLEIIPVLPPDLRPLIPSEDGLFSTSDLNDLYRRVINRNNRLKRLLELDAPDIIICNEKRMLQEAVDVLFDNGSRGRVITGVNNRRLDSIGDSLLIPNNLTGQFRDYSYIKNSFQTFLYASLKMNRPELIDVFLAFCRGLCLSFDFSIAEEKVKSMKLTIDPKTQYLIGQLFEFGYSVSEDFEEAINWYAKAAEQGNAMAQHCLGEMYLTGRGVSHDKKKAFEWYSKAAENGIPPAQYNLGWMFQNGIGIRQNNTLASEWYAKAAEQGNAMAQYNLAMMYMYGEGVTQEQKRAVDWCIKSAEQENAMAQHFLGDIYLNGMGVHEDVDRAQEWYTKAEEHEKEGEQCDFGNWHMEAQGLTQNKFIVEFPSVSINSMLVPEFCGYYQSTDDMDRHQLAFYKQLEHRLNNGEYLDVHGNITYIFVYLYKLISLWDDIGLNNLRQHLIHISELYKLEEKISLYCLSWANDCFLGLKKYEEYLECTKPHNLYGTRKTKYSSNLRLNIQKHISLEADPVDILLLTSGRKTKFITSNQLLYKEKIKIVFSLFAERNGSWFNILNNWMSHKGFYDHWLFSGVLMGGKSIKFEFQLAAFYSCYDYFAEISILSKEAENNAKKEIKLLPTGGNK